MSRQGRVGCKHCHWKGYTKHGFWNGEKEEVTVAVCSECKDKRGYNLYVKNKYGKGENLHLLPGQEPDADVIDFQKYKDNQEMSYIDEKEKKELGKKQLEEYGEIPKSE
ncbi:hypothetical protein N9948_02125 [bacterium]|nr:hypothetical protein [bacterium]